MVYDVVTQKIDQIPSLLSKRDLIGNDQLQQCGIHSVQINPSRTLLATGARNTCDIAIYRLPTLDPVCVGESAHRDWVSFISIKKFYTVLRQDIVFLKQNVIFKSIDLPIQISHMSKLQQQVIK